MCVHFEYVLQCICVNMQSKYARFYVNRYVCIFVSQKMYMCLFFTYTYICMSTYMHIYVNLHVCIHIVLVMRLL